MKTENQEQPEILQIVGLLAVGLAIIWSALSLL